MNGTVAELTIVLVNVPCSGDYSIATEFGKSAMIAACHEAMAKRLIFGCFMVGDNLLSV